MTPRRLHVPLALLFGLVVSCSSQQPDGGTTQPSTVYNAGHRTTPVPTQVAAAAPLSCPAQTLSAMTLRQRVGQLFIAGVTATKPTSAELRMIARGRLGGVILMGRSDIGVQATRRITDRLQRQNSSTPRVKLWVAADQEGGYVQELSGPGFSVIPTALTQGTWSLSTLRGRAQQWGQELRDAGVNLDLAPVMDTVPRRLGTANRPIGFYYREYGHRVGVVGRHGVAFHQGMQAAGVQTTAKHFPGLGRVRRNTDTARAVTDRITTRRDRYLRPFQKLVNAQVPFVMVSSARYTRIDPHHIAAFSPVVLRRMLRGDLGFTGVIVSDSLNAAALAGEPVGRRAVRFVRAGGTVALATEPSTVTKMLDGVLRQSATRQGLRQQVNADALTVLRAKARAGLLHC